MAITGGYFNSLNGDRKYNADQMNMFFEGLLGKGVFENVGGCLQVTAAGGLKVNIATGKLIDSKGRWLRNDSITSLTLDAADVTLNRYDAVVVGIDSSIGKREASIYIKKGTAATSPTKPTMTRDLNLEEYCLAYVYVRRGVTAITQSAVTDTRGDNKLCGFVTGLIKQVPTSDLLAQYKAVFEEQEIKNQNDFNEWFNDVKETLATATLIRSYMSTHIAGKDNTMNIPIGISQYSVAVDILMVYINGLRLMPDVEYTITSSEMITLKKGVSAGTPVTIEVLKSIDGSDAETVVQQVYEIQERNAKLDKYIYHTTGENDNLKLSKLCQAALTESVATQIKIEVVGSNFAVGAPESGEGTTTSRYKYFNLGLNSLGTPRKKVILDFGKCDHINATKIKANSIMFFGSNVQVENLSMLASGESDITFVENARVWYKNCDITMQGSGKMCFARMAGEFDTCRIDVTSESGEAFCFETTGKHYIRATGCTCLAYTKASGVVSAAGYSPSGQDNAILLMTNCNCPQITKTGYNQSNSIKINSGKFALYGNIVFAEPSLYSASAGEMSGTITANVPL